ncbi:hypothetical protein RMATCC62417_15716 [Rhizopus microsporus]|nr:hypothetical protein RMATCC62417_15716 [Rhizopus microsporus]
MNNLKAKRTRRIPVDAQWCINNIDSLSPKSFFICNNHFERASATRRYKLIVERWIDSGEKTRLLIDLAQWKKSEEAVSFWKERSIVLLLTESETFVGVQNKAEEIICNIQQQNRWMVNDVDITEIFFRYRSNIMDILNNNKDGIFLETRVLEIMGFIHVLFLAPEHSDVQRNVFSEALLDEIYAAEIQKLMDKPLRPTSDMFLKQSHIIFDIEQKTTTIAKGAIMLTQVAYTAPYYEQRLLMGVARLMEELPKKAVKNNQIGEAELWGSFSHPLLAKILSDNERDIRSVTSGKFGASLGFGECKTSDKCSTASLCKDVIKLTQLAQRSININSIKSVFCFQIHGFTIAFYMANLSHEGVYTFTQLAKLEFPNSLEELPLFVNMKTISLLLQVSQCFWEHCYLQKQCLDLKTKMVQEVDHNVVNSLIHGSYNDARPCPINFK